jgi:hypothetical protein
MASQNVRVKSGYVMDILPSTGVTTNVTGAWYFKDAPNAGISASVVGSGAVAATVTIQVSNDGVNPCATSAGVITLSGTGSNADGFATNSAWKYIRAVVSGISGTNATVNCQVCV